MIELNVANALPYLGGRLTIDANRCTVACLGGGISNTVLLVEDGRRRLVLKQSLTKLRVAEEWLSDRERIYREADALRHLAPCLPSGSLPDVLFEDRENCIFAMTAAPAGCRTWKELLLEGKADPRVASRIGEMLARMITCGKSNPELCAHFAGQAVFEQLRLDPYYRSTARRHPDLGAFFEQLSAMCRDRRYSPVHGDWSPKNFLVSDTSVIAIDWEVIHTGDPAFDAAFLTNHLVLKAIHKPEYAPCYRAAALSFWASLLDGVPADARVWFETSAMRHLAGLMLARVDGKSPVEYLTEPERIRTRNFALSLIARPPDNAAEVFFRLTDAPYHY